LLGLAWGWQHLPTIRMKAEEAAHPRPNMGRLAGRCHDNVTRIKVNVTEQLGLFWKVGNNGL
jgi:hypothetical protein